MVRIMRPFEGLKNISSAVHVPDSKRFAFFCYYYEVSVAARVSSSLVHKVKFVCSTLRVEIRIKCTLLLSTY